MALEGDLGAGKTELVRGACAGAGFGWACACDLRFAAQPAAEPARPSDSSSCTNTTTGNHISSDTCSGAR